MDYGLTRDGDSGQLPAAGELVAERLAAGSRVLIHCSAGLHRTGLVAFEALSRLGLDDAQAVEAIRSVRPVTGDAVAELIHARGAGLTAADRGIGQLDPPGTLDVRSVAPYPGGVLSNFTAHEFAVEGVTCASMEGFLQSLKTNDPDLAAEIRALSGKAAKRAGRALAHDGGSLFWQGRELRREDEAYQRLLDAAFESLFEQSASARQALVDTGEAVLTHRHGLDDPSATILTSQEFCSRLMRLRAAPT